MKPSEKQRNLFNQAKNKEKRAGLCPEGTVWKTGEVPVRGRTGMWRGKVKGSKAIWWQRGEIKGKQKQNNDRFYLNNLF